MPKAKTDAAPRALSRIRSGHRVFIGSGAGEPQRLVRALVERAEGLADVEAVHLLTLGAAPYRAAAERGSVRHNALFIGGNVRDLVRQGLADYTPCFLSEIPGFFRSGRLPLDAALIQVSPPRNGHVSLGVSVDIVRAAVESAPYVVAQVNPRMPWTGKESRVAVDAIDTLVEYPEPLCELPPSAMTASALWIGRYCAQLIEDGATLQLGIGAIPDAVLAALGDKRDLGIHTEMISDGVLPLVERGVINGARKTLLPGKIVTSFCLGSRRLYDAVDRNPVFDFRPTEFTNDPATIAKNERMVSVNSALEVDLTGQVAADSLGHNFYSGVGGQIDFIRGAAASKGGRSIIALPATAKGGRVSRIVVAMDAGTGVVTTRADVEFVVTEYGIAHLKGRTIRERAVALIQIAHPKFRPELRRAAEKAGLLDKGHLLPDRAARYEVGLEARRSFAGAEVLIRPIKPTDERKLKELFYSQSEETTLMRFGIPLKRLSERQFQDLVSMDFVNSVAIGAFTRVGGRERLIGVARYYRIPGQGLAESAVTVHDRFQGKGLGTFLVDYLVWIAKERGLEGFCAQIVSMNDAMRGMLRKCFRKIETRFGRGEMTCVTLFKHWRGRGNPAGSRTPARPSKAG